MQETSIVSLEIPDISSRKLDISFNPLWPHHEVHSKYYGRKTARALKTGAVDLYETLYPSLQFNGVGDVLEIGFGMGDFLLHQALLHPERQFIGIEPFKTGLISLLKKIKQHNIKNIRIYHGVVHDILDQLPKFFAIYILYPDPWPKQKHHKRRLIQPAFLQQLRHYLRPGGALYIASDHADYQHWIEVVLQKTFGLVFTPEEKARSFSDWIPTKYEKRAKQEGRLPQYYTVFADV